MPIPVYTLADDLRALFPNNQFNQTYNPLFQQCIEDASREIDAFLKRSPGAFAADVATARYFTWKRNTDQKSLWVDEMADVPSSVAMALGGIVDSSAGTGGTYTALAATDYWCWPDNAIGNGMPYKRLDLNVMNGAYSIWYPYPRGIKISCKWGFSTSANIPGEIKKATKIQAFRFFKRSQQGFQDVGAITELGQLKYVKKLDPDVENILNAEKFATSIL